MVKPTPWVSCSVFVSSEGCPGFEALTGHKILKLVFAASAKHAELTLKKRCRCGIIAYETTLHKRPTDTEYSKRNLTLT